MADRIKNKVAVVIGASQGIGEGIAIRLAEEGAKLVLGDIKKESGEVEVVSCSEDDVETVETVDIAEEEVRIIRYAR